MKKFKLFSSLAVSVLSIFAFSGLKNNVDAKMIRHDNVFEIHSESDFHEFSQSVANGYDYTNCDVELMEDLDFKKTSFKPLSYFNGHFNGNGHYIYNLQLDYSLSDFVGFIMRLGSNGVLENLTVYDTWFGPQAYIKGNNYVGCFVGYNEGTVKKCRNASCEILSKGDYAGSIVGYNAQTGSVVKCRTSRSTNIIVNCDNITGYSLVTDTNSTTNNNRTSSVTVSKSVPIYGNSTGKFIGYNLGYFSKCEKYLFFA